MKTEFLKNYTSTTAASVTIGRIEKVLVLCGALDITKEYSPQGQVAALHFTVMVTDGKRLTIRMPSDIDAVQESLWMDYVDGERLDPTGTRIVAWGSRKRRNKASFRDQAERTAWKLMQDWVEVQMSLVKMHRADVAQVFLAYVWDANRRVTFYTALKERGYSGLLLTDGNPTTA